ncbi:hypothetical protein GDO78_012360 [Eleutherodactylus coqui]|uniref:Uncharacterized protein n=1 Tax=Eleutherodactylus coqui TaxID=57060 RepID=A0A8J6K7T6_ELECQ|nr:hypothetical protein GDO78_012360 [Eleutherodactylus coqui]
MTQSYTISVVRLEDGYGVLRKNISEDDIKKIIDYISKKTIDFSTTVFDWPKNFGLYKCSSILDSIREQDKNENGGDQPTRPLSASIADGSDSIRVREEDKEQDGIDDVAGNVTDTFINVHITIPYLWMKTTMKMMTRLLWLIQRPSVYKYRIL